MCGSSHQPCKCDVRERRASPEREKHGEGLALCGRDCVARGPPSYRGIPAMTYTVSTFCSGRKYEALLPHWRQRVAAKCPCRPIAVFTDADVPAGVDRSEWGWVDRVRLERILGLLESDGHPVIQCDLDVIVEKDLRRLVELEHDLILSTEPGGFPTECSAKLGVGACSGFYILKPAGARFAARWLDELRSRRFGCCTDQVALMHRLATSGARPEFELLRLDGRSYRNAVLRVDGLKVCILDNDLVTRDPVGDTGQFANHINCENVGGVRRMIRYFYEDLDNLPLTCRCGQLGDSRVCGHVRHERDRREAWARRAMGWRRLGRRAWLMLRHPVDRW